MSLKGMAYLSIAFACCLRVSQAHSPIVDWNIRPLRSSDVIKAFMLEGQVSAFLLACICVEAGCNFVSLRSSSSTSTKLLTASTFVVYTLLVAALVVSAYYYFGAVEILLLAATLSFVSAAVRTWGLLVVGIRSSWAQLLHQAHHAALGIAIFAPLLVVSSLYEILFTIQRRVLCHSALKMGKKDDNEGNTVGLLEKTNSTL
jgi:hypothetical protein